MMFAYQKSEVISMIHNKLSAVDSKYNPNELTLQKMLRILTELPSYSQLVMLTEEEMHMIAGK